MKNTYKLIAWFVAGVLLLYVLKNGWIENVDDYIYDLCTKYILVSGFYYEDYLQFLPVFMLLCMRSMNIKSRNTRKQMIVSIVFSLTLMSVTVFPMKEFSHILRPDGIDFLSFPSGHTAMAFTAASLLYKEYGFRSKWICVVAYLPAVMTGIARQLHNRHWTSDVIAGAIIGILAVEVGYFLAGIVFKKKIFIQ